MSRKKDLGKEKKLGLKLTNDERKLILGSPIHIHNGLAEPIRAAATGALIMLTLDELEDLGGYVAAAANHATEKKLRTKLDAIVSKIDDLMETDSDEESRRSLNFEDTYRQKILADQSIELAEWAARMLIGSEQLGIKGKPVARFPLAWAERAVLLFTAVDKKTLTRLEAEKPVFTVAEVGGFLMAVAEALLDAPPLHSNALLSVAKSLMTCLEEEVTEAIRHQN